MHLHDLDIPVGIEGARHLGHHAQQQVDAQAHVRRQDDGGLPAWRCSVVICGASSPVVPMMCTLRCFAANSA